MRVPVGEVALEVDDRGSGTPVLLLHGWPDRGRLWRHQADALGSAGFRTVVPDLRGFGSSDRPEPVEAYGLPNLVADVLGLLDHLGVERAHVVGHDWGAALAWVFATLAPDRVESLVALSVGHPAAFAGAGLAQREKSWYMLLFQFDGIAEEWLSKDGFRNMREFGASHPDLEAAIADVSRPGALTAGLNWYRANVPPESLLADPLELPPVQAPTMGVWSTGDMALTEAQMEGSGAFVAGDWRYERVEGAGHWMQLEAPDRVNELLLDFLRS